jgi:hypothetical protein
MVSYLSNVARNSATKKTIHNAPVSIIPFPPVAVKLPAVSTKRRKHMPCTVEHDGPQAIGCAIGVFNGGTMKRRCG